MAYISKEKTIETIEEVWNRKYAKCGLQPLRDCYKMLMKRLKSAPTAEVVEVRHGEWKEIKCGDGVFDYYFKCSNCGGTTPPKAFPVAPDYCPHCGAKMDGGGRL